ILDSLQQNAVLIGSESDQLVTVAGQVPPVPDALYKSDLVTWSGGTARYGFVLQPAADIIRSLQAQTTFGVTGAATVAIIDTGVDPDHPGLRSVLLPGYDFTRNV